MSDGTFLKTDNLDPNIKIIEFEDVTYDIKSPISIEGVQEPTALRDIINHIYKRFICDDNENGFSFNNRDIAKVYDPNTKSYVNANGEHAPAMSTQETSEGSSNA